MDDIKARFGLLTDNNVNCLADYIKRLTDASSPNQATGTLAQRTIQLSFDDIKETLPMQLSSRSLATYNMLANKTCADYVSQVADAYRTTYLC